MLEKEAYNREILCLHIQVNFEKYRLKLIGVTRILVMS